MKSLTVAYHDTDKQVFGRVQVIAESAFSDYSRRGFVEVEVDDESGEVKAVDRDDEPELTEAANQAQRAKAEADRLNAADAAATGDEPEAKAKPEGKAGGSPAGSTSTKAGGDA